MLEVLLNVFGVVSFLFAGDTIFNNARGTAGIYQWLTGRELFPDEPEIHPIDWVISLPDPEGTIRDFFHVEDPNSAWWYLQLDEWMSDQVADRKTAQELDVELELTSDFAAMLESLVFCLRMYHLQQEVESRQMISKELAAKAA